MLMLLISFYLIFSYTISLSVIQSWITHPEDIPVKGCLGKVLIITCMPILLLLYFFNDTILKYKAAAWLKY